MRRLARLRASLLACQSLNRTIQVLIGVHLKANVLFVELGRAMFECSICGLLSLNAISCPACGSQNLKDLSTIDSERSDLPAEIPGLDEAAESWREIEGDDAHGDGQNDNLMPDVSQITTLPFGFSGESNYQKSRLPFGIGSHAEGIPFDSDNVSDEQTLPDDYQLVSEDAELTTADNQTIAKEDSLVEVIVKRRKPVRIQPLPETYMLETSIIQDNSLPKDFEIPSKDIDEIPEEWKIDVVEANMDEIYSTKQEVVEVIHEYEDDIVVFDHKTTQSNVIPNNFDDELEVLSLELHPARALDVDLSRNPECREDLDAGYFAIARNSWAEAAISFQKIAARMHGDSAVYNNYGLSLLQRAIEMAKDDDESIQMLAASQFESAILALREAAKTGPDEPVILLNLAHALLVSGRSEKALKIVGIHNQKYPNSVEGVNLEAATLVSLGQSINAKAKLTQYRGDSIVEENLARLL